MHHVKVFRCYRHSVASAITVEAQSHDEAAMIASERKGWAVEWIVTRYVVTKCSGARPEFKSRGRSGAETAQWRRLLKLPDKAVA